MQGPIENALMLVAAGNAWLGGRDISGFWPDAPTFTFMKACEFRKPPASGKDTDEFPLVAADPMAWFASLKPWCTGLRLHCVEGRRGPNQQIDAPDRMLVAFVGGGPRWLIEAAGKQTCQLWEGFHRFGERDDPDRKVWLCTHILQSEISPSESQPVDLAVALSDLRIVLPEIEAYARTRTHDNFADCFLRAIKLIEQVEIDDAEWVDDVMRYSGFDRRQVAILQAINHAWVFGGMGSWNDLGEGGEPYNSLSERLFTALNDTIAGLANSTYRG